jgi:RNA polymerase sigma-70 factor (ECF subfamily)
MSREETRSATELSNGVRAAAATDAELLRAAGRADGAAFSGLIDRHAARLYRTARWLCATEHDAEDVLQETFLAALEGADRYRGQASVQTWLRQILMRQAAKVWHRDRRWRNGVAITSADLAAPSVHESAAADIRLDLHAALQRLAPDHRRVIVLREIEQLSYSEIAEVLGVPVGTVESRLHRARHEMRQRMSGHEGA